MFLYLFLLFFTPQAMAQSSSKIQGLLVQADSLSRDSDKDLVELQGHVQIVKDDQHISCDHAKIYLRTKQIEMLGRVKMISPKTTVGGDIINLDYETNTGIIYNGYVQSGTVIFEGQTLQKISDDEYFVTKAIYTTCTNCPASWSFSGQRIRAELGGYAYIKSSVLKFGSVPVLWLPYLIVPLKSDRQSGLLTPEFEQSSEGGFAVSESFFWAINRSEDATLGIKSYERRGLKGLVNYRYVLAENSFGELDTALIRDRVFKNNDQLNLFRPADTQQQPINRWFLKYNQYFELPNGYVNRASINTSSDLLYSKDFPLETGNYGNPALENRFSITKNEDTTHWHVENSYYINQLRANPLGGNDDAVHKLPEISYSKNQTLIGSTNLSYSFDLNYVNFARGTKGYDDLSAPVTMSDGTKIRHIKYQGNDATNYNCENSPNCKLNPDGQYDSYVDLLRTGQRLDIQPSLYYPMQISDGIDLFPKLSYRETHYSFDAGDDRTSIRRFVRGELSARTTFSRVYGDLQDPLSNRVLHEIQPEIKYTRIPWIDQKSHPFFGFTKQNSAPISANSNVSDGDLGSNNGLQFDYNDRIYDTQLFTYGFTNRWVEKKWVNNIPESKQFALLKVSQSFDEYQAQLDDKNKEPWSDVAVVLNVNLDQIESYTNLNYFPTHKVTNTSTRLRLSNNIGQFFQVGMTRNYAIIPGQDVDSKTRTEDYSFASGFQGSYINLMGKIVYDGNWANSSNNKQFKSWAYIAQLKPPGECWVVTVIQEQRTAGDTNFKLNFEFSFDGVPKPGFTPEALDNYGF